ncbi:MAG: DUF1838 family protein [Gammaproteobacteria bacterium]|nr:DUF1838 family protein [Gammaproteobacteria bacterium]
MKLASSLEDGVETCGYFSGTQYAVIGSQESGFRTVEFPFVLPWQMVSPWRPWILMDNREGGILGITSVFSLESTQELLPHVLAYTEKHYPQYLHAPDQWVEPNMTTWETFAAERKPAPIKKD